MRNTDAQIRQHLIEPKKVRQTLGFLGILFPFALAGIVFISGDCALQPSISHYYHTVAGGVFVGFLCAYAMFLFAYRGYDYKDSRAANVAATFAIITAVVPTTWQEEYACTRAPWFSNQLIHLTAAGLFFIVLAYISIFLFRKTDAGRPQTMRKKKRNTVYLICGIGMLACLGAIVIYMLLANKNPNLKELKLVFWFESFALLLFGVSWLVKGEFVLAD